MAGVQNLGYTSSNLNRPRPFAILVFETRSSSILQTTCLSLYSTLSIATSMVPSQWKTAYIRPIPKVPSPSGHTDFRPISITPILTRCMEKIVVRQFLYPSFRSPPSTLTFSDQFAFRPTGSTVAALIYILHTVTQLLTTHQYVIVLHSTSVKLLIVCVMPHSWAKWPTWIFLTTFITGWCLTSANTHTALNTMV